MENKNINLYKFMMGIIYGFIAVIHNNNPKVGVFDFILSFICIYLLELTVYKLEYNNQYVGGGNNLITKLIYLLIYIFIDSGIKKEFSFENLVIGSFYIVFSYVLCIITMKYEVIYGNKKYHSIFMESKFWERRSENFKWNYSDLRRVAYRSSMIVILISISYLGIYWSIVLNNKIGFNCILLFISLFNLEYQAMLDRKDEISNLLMKKYSYGMILKLLTTQFFWMILRGIFIGIIIVIISGYFSNLGILGLMENIQTVILLATISYSPLALAVLKYLVLEKQC